VFAASGFGADVFYFYFAVFLAMKDGVKIAVGWASSSFWLWTHEEGFEFSLKRFGGVLSGYAG
jgi:hypothetical protein